MKKRFRFGLKLWSTNDNYLMEAEELYNKSLFNYIELYVVPSSFKKYNSFWKKLNIPYVIHAPHYYGGLNLSDKKCFAENKLLINESISFADELKSDIVIFHPGTNGRIEETIKQLKLINDNRIVIENKPKIGLNNEICIGYSPEQIKLIISETSCDFCLDIGHAINAANHECINSLGYINDFNKLKPIIYHLTDGDFNGIKDSHKHYGKGTFPIKDILKLIPEDAMITNEAKKMYNDKLDDFIMDIKYLEKILKK